MMPQDVLPLILALSLPNMSILISASSSSAAKSDWYKQLKKPSWTPPGWVFPIVWTSLYLMMGVASWLVWLQGGFEKQSVALIMYFFQLSLNFIWTPLFFGMRKPGAALVDIMLLWLSILGTIYFFWHVTPVAAYLLVPYILWVSLASTINFYIWFHYPASLDNEHPKIS